MHNRVNKVAGDVEVIERTAWWSVIPWVMTVASLLVLACVAWFLLENIFWFRTQALPDGATRGSSFMLYVFHLHLAMIKRSVALFTGFALIFVGTAVSFYTLRNPILIEGSSASASAKLATFSPGLVALLLGTLLIIFTINSKDTFDSLPDEPVIPTATPLLQPDVRPQ